MGADVLPVAANGLVQDDGVLALLGDVFNALPVAVLVVDARREIVMFNHEAELLLGHRSADVLGKTVDVFIPDPLRAGHAEHHDAYLADPAPRKMGANRDLLARRADGTLVPVEIALKPIPGTVGPMVIAAIIDLSARKALEAQALAANAELERRVGERTAELEHSLREQRHMLQRLEAAHADLERLTREDPLTGLANRREFAERLAVEYERSVRHEHPLTVAMLDLDHFKAVNDAHGHAMGDEVLRHIGAIVRGQCRIADLPARYGGEEFVLALPDTSLLEARSLCERIRGAVEAHDWDAIVAGLRVTVSIGIAMRAPDESADEAVAAADQQLYEAKRRGRNRVCVRSTA
jgi:diguanylate cyclase (GGDEF)-like protein/PAS domain S-box-containing protein